MEVSGLYRPEIIQYSNAIYGINWLVGGAIAILKNMKVNGKVKNYLTYMNLIFFPDVPYIPYIWFEIIPYIYIYIYIYGK